MKFLIDVCIGQLVEHAVRSSLNMYDFKCIRDINPKMTDDAILRLAWQEKRAIITSDKDFGELVHQRRIAHSGVILFRFDELSISERAEAICRVIGDFGHLLPNHFCVFQNGMLRVRQYP